MGWQGETGKPVRVQVQCAGATIPALPPQR